MPFLITSPIRLYNFYLRAYQFADALHVFNEHSPKVHPLRGRHQIRVFAPNSAFQIQCRFQRYPERPQVLSTSGVKASRIAANCFLSEHSRSTSATMTAIARTNGSSGQRPVIWQRLM
jgi:hypothetical protein